MTASPRSTDQLIDQLRHHWQAQDSLTAEQLLADNPDIASTPASALDIIYAEVLLREESGESPDEAEYLQRFPQYSEHITRQFQLHRALSEYDDDDDDVDPAEALGADLHSTQSPLGPDTLPVAKKTEPRIPSIPGFEVQEIAGRGGSGVVYRAFDSALKRSVAIKLLHSGDEEQQQQLTREAEASAALDHPNIARVHQIGEWNNRPFLVLEYVSGEALTDRLQRGPLEFKPACKLLIKVADAIEYAHEQGVIHRDLKPGNVLLGVDDRPRVCDFGLARKLDSQFTLHATGSVVGTPAYMAPEQARGDSVTRAADLYALGATLYHTLTGRPPFQASTPWEILNQVMTDDPVSVRDLNASIPKDLETICHRAMHKNPERRFPDAAEFSAELSRFLRGEPIHSRPVSAWEKSLSWCRRHPAISSVVSAVALALIAIAAIAIASERRVKSALKQTTTALTKAETQRDVAFDAMSRLVHEVATDLQKHEASVEAREQVLQSAIIGLKRIIETNSDHYEARLTLVEARCMYAYIVSQLGRNKEATDQYLAAIDLMSNDGSRRARTELAFATSLLAQHYIRVADQQGAVSTAEKAITIAQRLVDEDPSDIRPRQLLATAYENRGNALASLERTDEGLAELRKSEEITILILEDEPGHERASSQLVDTQISIAVLEFNLGNLSRAEIAVSEATRLINESGISLKADTQLARQYLKVCRLSGVGHYARTEYEGAQELLEKSRAGIERLIRVEPTRPGFRLQLALSCGDLARCYLATGQVEKAVEATETEIATTWKGMQLGGPEYRVQRSAILGAELRLAELRLRQRDLAAATKATERAAEVVRPLEEEFSLQQMLSMIDYQVEILKGIDGQPSKAAPEDIEVSRRIYLAWRKLRDGDRSLFDESQEQIEKDIAAAQHPLIKSSLIHMHSLCQALVYKLLVDADQSTPEQLESQAQRVIAAVNVVRSAGNADPNYFLGLPEFDAIRNSPSFRREFQLP